MTITELKDIFRHHGAPIPFLLHDDGKLEIWDYEGRSYFKWLHPLDFSLPAAFYGPLGFYRVDRLEARGAEVHGSLTPMSAGQFVSSYLLSVVPFPVGKGYPLPKDIGRIASSAEDYREAFGGIVVD